MSQGYEDSGAGRLAGTAAFTEHDVPVEQGRVHVRDYPGAGPAFVLMHGFPDNSHIYDHLLPYLVAGGRRAVAFDFLGFGASEKPVSAMYSFAQQLADLTAVVDHLGLGSVVPVAHDASGAAAVNFAIDHPERTESLVILNAAFAEAPTVAWPELIELFASRHLNALSHAIAHDPEMFGWIVNFQRERFKAGLEERHKSRYDAFLGPLIDRNFSGRPGAGPAFAQMTAQFFDELGRNTARIPQMEALDMPVKVIWGTHDPYLDVGLAEDFRAHLKHASLHLVAAGHWLQIDEPELVASKMLG